MDAKHTGKIYGINGPVIYLKGRTGFKMSEMVYVGEERLVGEVISLDKDRTTIQVYEETSGLGPGEPVESMDFRSEAGRDCGGYRRCSICYPRTWNYQ